MTKEKLRKLEELYAKPHEIRSLVEFLYDELSFDEIFGERTPEQRIMLDKHLQATITIRPLEGPTGRIFRLAF